jgi:hypothetical protein
MAYSHLVGTGSDALTDFALGRPFKDDGDVSNDTSSKKEFNLSADVGGPSGHTLLQKRPCSRDQAVAQQSGRGCVRTHVPGMDSKRFVLSLDDNTEFRSRCE